MNGKLTINRSFHVKLRRNGSKRLEDGPAVVKPTGRIPLITRLISLNQSGQLPRYAQRFIASPDFSNSIQPGNVSFWTYYDYATGTQEPGAGGVYRTFNQLFGGNHAYFGYIDLVGRQNIRDLSFQIESNPQPWFQLRTQYHIFHLDEARDALYNLAGVPIRRDPTGAAGDDVGDEIDLLSNFHLTPHQDFLLGYSRLFAGNFIRATGPGNDPQYFYAQYSFRF